MEEQKKLNEKKRADAIKLKKEEDEKELIRLDKEREQMSNS